MTRQEMEKGFKEIWELFKETDRHLKETDRHLKETDRHLKETDRHLKETDRQLKETDQHLKETDRQIAALSKAIGDLGGKWGRFVEGIVAPGVERLFREKGIEINHIYPRAKARRNGRQMEVDILAHNGDEAILIAVKSTLSVDDVKAHLQQLAEFKDFFPDHRHRKLYGAVAGIVIEEGVDRYAYQQGLYVIAQSGETIRILNDDKFTPRVW